MVNSQLLPKMANSKKDNTYRITLTDTNLSYTGQDDTTTIYIFSIAKQEIVNVPLNADMIYLSFSDISNMAHNGTMVASASIPVLSRALAIARQIWNPRIDTNGTFIIPGVRTFKLAIPSPSTRVFDLISVIQAMPIMAISPMYRSQRSTATHTPTQAPMPRMCYRNRMFYPSACSGYGRSLGLTTPSR